MARLGKGPNGARGYDVARPGQVWLGAVWLGGVRHGMARQGPQWGTE